MAQIIKPDVVSFNRLYESYRLHNSPAIFLAGSIEIGLAENWQDRIIDFFQKEKVIFSHYLHPILQFFQIPNRYLIYLQSLFW